MQLEPRKHIIIVVIVWLVGLSVSLSWNLLQSKQHSKTENLEAARAFVQQILITRTWNAIHGGLYLRISDLIQPNPFLHVPHRDIETLDGMQLTLINPAFMTRMISEIAREQGQVKFHLTSLNPINPNNKAVPWERISLQAFETNQLAEYYLYKREKKEELFHFMAPLVTTTACLQCHAKQGYREGDIRGGISITFPVHKKDTSALIFSHLFILCAGIIFIAGFGRRIIQLTERLKKQSYVDGLTQIANRKYFDETLHKEWLRCRRMKTSLSLIMVDIDHFKLYNDTYGHQAGDSCLQRVAQALETAISRPADLLARYGGEEFVVVLPETSSEGGKVVAELLQATVENLHIPHSASTTAGYVTISLGVATTTSRVIPKKELIEYADKALYASKNSGRNTFLHADDI